MCCVIRLVNDISLHPYFSAYLLHLVANTGVVPPAAALSTNSRPSEKQPIVHDIWDFSLWTWVENLAIQHNDQILVTLLSSPEVYQVDPTREHSASLVYTFPELQPDVFYVAVGSFSLFTLPP